MSLEMLLNTMKDTGGALGSFQQGQTAGYADQKTLADTASTQANTARTTQMTPSMVANSQNQAETSRLGNLPGQAEEQQGLPGTNAQIKSQQAQQILKQIPQKTLAEAHDKVQKTAAENLGIISDTMQSGGDMKTAFAKARDHLSDAGANLPPDQLQQELAKFDAASQQALQKYSAIPNGSQQFLNEVKQHRYSIASTASLADPTTQGKLTEENVRGGFGVQEAQIGAAAKENVASTRAASVTGRAAKTSAPEMIAEYTKRSQDMNLSQEDRDLAATTANLLAHAGGKLATGILGPQETQNTAAVKAAQGTPASNTPAPNSIPTVIPTKGAVDMLRSNPSLRSAFEAKYGDGSAAKYLGK